MVATGSTTGPWWIYAIGFAFAIFWGAYNAYLSHRQRERKRKKNEPTHSVNNNVGEEARKESDLTNGARNDLPGKGNTIHPKFRTLYGTKPLLGVIIGLGIIVGNVLFFSFVIPARTSEEIITTIVLVIVGVGVAAFSNLVGFMRVSKARVKDGSGRNEETL